MTPRLLSALAALAVLVGAAGCGTSVPAAESLGVPSPAATATPVPASTPTPVPTPTPAPTATPRPTSTPTPTPTPAFRIRAELAARLPVGWTGEVEGLALDLDALRSPEPPAGGVTGPVVPNPSRWQYNAVLGRLGPRQRVVPAVADAPPGVAGTAPLTGLPVDDTIADGGPTVVVKIDNVPVARPQTGINQADILYEELVESGVTRFAAVFHSDVPSVVGPVRSGRSTDIGIVASFGTPVFAYSGANSIFDRLIAKQPIVNRGAEVAGGYWRSSGRAAPHNMYTSAADQRAAAGEGAPPPAHFVFAEPPAATEAGRPAAAVRLRYLAGAGFPIEFRWDAAAGGWLRWQNGTPHVDTDGVQLAPRNLVVQFVEYLDTGLTDKWGEVLYEGVSVGTGPALVFTDGAVVDATWTRPRLADPATFTDADGDHVTLAPGRTFVALIAPGGVTWE